MSVEGTHIRRLEKWARDMERESYLSEMEQADLRSLLWAVSSLRVGLEATAKEMAARAEQYQAERRNEFADRRANRTALRELKRLRKIVTAVSDQQALASIDRYLSQGHARLGNGDVRGFEDGEGKAR